MGISFLSQLSNLTELSVANWNSHTKIGPVGVTQLTQLKNLRILDIGKPASNEESNNIGDTGARAISKLHNLRELYLGND